MTGSLRSALRSSLWGTEMRRMAGMTMVVLLAACQPATVLPDAGPVFDDGEFALAATVGNFTHESGASLALLASIRDKNGEGVQRTWRGEVRTPAGEVIARFDYGDGTPTRWAATWWPTVPLDRGAALDIAVFDGAGRELHQAVAVWPQAGIDAPAPRLTAAADAIEWAPVSGAKAYRCTLEGNVSSTVTAISTSPECSLASLGDGAWQATALAFSADLPALSTSVERRPTLPDSFDVSQGRVAWTKGATGATQLKARLGAIQYSGTGQGVAIFVSARTAAGQAPAAAWDFELSGPALPSSAPMKFSLPAGTGETVAWLYDVAPQPAAYLLKGKSGAEAIAMTLDWSAGPGLSAPSAVSANPRGAGGAEVTWSPVSGAVSYFVSVWNRTTGVFAAGRWVDVSPATFSAGTLAGGEAYDVYVAATNADVLAGTCPPSLSVSENTYAPARFTAQ